MTREALPHISNDVDERLKALLYAQEMVERHHESLLLKVGGFLTDFGHYLGANEEEEG